MVGASDKRGHRKKKVNKRGDRGHLATGLKAGKGARQSPKPGEKDPSLSPGENSFARGLLRYNCQLLQKHTEEGPREGDRSFSLVVFLFAFRGAGGEGSVGEVLRKIQWMREGPWGKECLQRNRWTKKVSENPESQPRNRQRDVAGIDLVFLTNEFSFQDRAVEGRDSKIFI